MNRNRLITACIGSAAILIGINYGAWISALVPEEVRMLLVKALATAFFFVCFAVCIYILLGLWEVFKGLNQNCSDEQNKG